MIDDYLDGLFDDDLCDIASKDDKKDEPQDICIHTLKTNPRIENTTITVDKEVADFYKQFFDELIPFNGNPKGWEPYHAKR